MNIAIIGFGIIGKKYYEAIKEKCKYLNIKYICDLVEINSKEFNYVSEYKEIPLDDLDLIFITTPPSTHYEIADYFLSKGIKTFVEKPGTMLSSDFNLLIKKYNDLFNVVFHWNSGDEVLYLKDNSTMFDDFDEIIVEIFDPYYRGNMNQKKHLGGAWLDSGVNALSFLSLFVDLKEFKLTNVESEIDVNTNQDYYVIKTFQSKKQKITIKIDWTKDKNSKETTIKKKNTLIKIDHTNQLINYNNKTVFNNYKQDRLLSHYQNFFSEFKNYINNIEESIIIHNKLFEGDKK